MTNSTSYFGPCTKDWWLRCGQICHDPLISASKTTASRSESRRTRQRPFVTAPCHALWRCAHDSGAICHCARRALCKQPNLLVKGVERQLDSAFLDALPELANCVDCIGRALGGFSGVYAMHSTPTWHCRVAMLCTDRLAEAGQFLWNVSEVAKNYINEANSQTKQLY